MPGGRTARAGADEHARPGADPGAFRPATSGLLPGCRPATARTRYHRTVRPLRLGQDQLPALRRRAGTGPHRLPGGQRRLLAGQRAWPVRAHLPPADRLCVPGSQPVCPPRRARQPALRQPAHSPCGASGRPAAGRRPTRYRPPAAAPAGTSVRRRTTARRYRPRPADQPAPAADGRTTGLAGPAAPPGSHALPGAPAARAGHPATVCQPRPGRGGAPGRSPGRAGGGPRTRLRAVAGNPAAP